MVIALAATLIQAQFGGGDPSELAAAIQKATNRPVVVAAYKPGRIPGFAYEPELPKSLNLALKPHGYMLPPSMQYAVAPAQMPRWKMQISPLQQGQVEYQPASFESIWDEKKLSLTTKAGTALKLSSLNQMGFSKPVQVHWLYNDIPVATACSGISETEFLNLVAQAVGAKLFDDRDGFKINPDVKEIQYRTLATIKSVLTPDVLKSTSRSDLDRVDWLKTAIGNATNTQIHEAFKDPSSSALIMLSNPQKQTLYSQMASWEAGTPRANTQRGGGGSKEELAIAEVEMQESAVRRRRGMSYSILRQRTDFNQPMYIRLYANFNVTFEGASVANSNGQRAPIRF